MTLKRVTSPTEPAVSLEELKQHIDNAADTQDAYLQMKLDAAQAYVEDETGRALVTSTWEVGLGDWPTKAFLEIPMGNLQSVEWIRYADKGGVVRTVNPSVYKLARIYIPSDPPALGQGTADSGPGRIYLASGASWPSEELDAGEPIVIRVVCGWDGAASVPAPIKQAILMLASHWCRNRDAVATAGTFIPHEMELGFTRLISRY